MTDDRPLAERYQELPVDTRLFLERLSRDDLKVLIILLQSMRSMKWIAAVVGAVLGFIILFVQATEAVKHIWK